MANGRTPVRIRNQTHTLIPKYSMRIARQVAPNQAALEGQLELLQEHTRDIITYKSLGKLGVTLLMLDPVLHDILGVEKHRKIPPEILQNLETQLNGIFQTQQYEEQVVPLKDSFEPFDLYGSGGGRYLGLSLRATPELISDREVILQFLRDEYNISGNQLDKGLKRLKPHITIGEVQWEEIETAEQAYLRKNPSQYLMTRIRAYRRARLEQYLACPNIPIIPSTIVLNGLRAYCEQR